LLITKIKEINNFTFPAASSDAATREKITHLPPEVSNISELGKIQDKEAALKLATKVNEAVNLLKGE
jgi:regulator of Ty1 transposition protein 103